VVAVSGVARTSQQTRTTPANFGGCHTTPRNGHVFKNKSEFVGHKQQRSVTRAVRFNR
jgi:hypothetical protein